MKSLITQMFLMYAICFAPLLFIFITDEEISPQFQRLGICWLIAVFLLFGFFKSIKMGVRFLIVLISVGVWVWLIFPGNSPLSFEEDFFQTLEFPLVTGIIAGPLIFLFLKRKKKI